MHNDQITKELEQIAEVEFSYKKDVREGHLWTASLKPTIFLNLLKGEKYEVYMSWKTGTDDQMLDLQTLTTTSAEEAIERFRLYHSFATCGIDPQYLPEYEKWKRKKYKIPKDANLIAMSTIKYELRMPSRRVLGADRFFSRASRTGSTRVLYDGPTRHESVNIIQGEITHVFTRLHKDWGPVPENEVWEWFKKNMEAGRPDTTTFHKIKSYEKRLRELPWQEDLEAIYRHDGIWTKTIN